MLAGELILNFHGLGEAPVSASAEERKVWVPVAWFEAILAALPRAGTAVTFDDGNSSDAEQALPLLLADGRRASFFVIADRVGAAGHLGADQLRELADAGMAIGSHGLAHRDWRSLSERELTEELQGSRDSLERHARRPVLEAACPFGSYDRRVLRALRRAGYRRAYSSDGGATRQGSWLAARNSVHRERPLEHWLTLAAEGARTPGPRLLAKRIAKRLR